MKRLFAAINFPPEIKEQLSAYLIDLDWPNRGVSLIKPENFHVTLRFWGEDHPDNIDFGEYRPFNIKLTNIGLFPDENNPKFIVINIEDNQILKDIAKNLGAEKKLKPHITLARIRKKIDEKYFTQLNKIDFKPVDFEVSKIDLMNSKSEEGGSVYNIEKEFKL
ncbi:RNA 2',3'-cyclic phosphodiesterase [Patescibacteria group bacterium]|nr:RNA 2',3'-cyclic phosphodiesterase [Patescibacteria group bacterium]MBU1673578.1 RNA 2',3'-cyclic phosphodiesterase [Patescibacteria group bacterium]MBU1963480.1 RNA 2',3'-cyclic phosphodiesterase [Patescibacteria group bacterium]